MRSIALTSLLSAGLIFGAAAPAVAVERTTHQQVQHKKHVNTAKRVGVGTVGGAAVGALVGHPIAGAAAGAGAGALYDHHKKQTGHY